MTAALRRRARVKRRFLEYAKERDGIFAMSTGHGRGRCRREQRRPTPSKVKALRLALVAAHDFGWG